MPTRRALVRPRVTFTSPLLLSARNSDSDLVGLGPAGGPSNSTMTATVDGGADAFTIKF